MIYINFKELIMIKILIIELIKKREIKIEKINKE